MKKYYLIIFAFVTAIVQSQVVSIPDVNFKNKLLAANVNNTTAKDANDNNIKIDVNNNGEIEMSEALLVYKLFTPNNGTPPPRLSGEAATSQMVVDPIADLTGIAAFTNLTYLNLGGNQLTTVDLSNNTALVYLNCASNLFTSLDVTGLGNLETLLISSNQFTSFSTNGLPMLKNFYCSGNQITSLTLNSSPLLEELNCTSNLLPSIDFQSITNLKNLYIGSNPFASLDLSPLAQLLLLRCDNIGLPSVDLSNLPSLKNLQCYNNQFTTLDVSNLPALEFLNCNTNLITSLDFSNNPNIKTIDCSGNNLNSIVFQNNALLTDFNGNQNLFETLDFSDTGIRKVICSNNPNLTYINVKNGYVSPDYYYEAPLPWPFYYFTMDNLPALEYICHDEGEFGTVLVEHIGLQNVSRSTYCSFAPGGSYNTITGTVQFDCGGMNTPFANQKIKITNGTEIGYTYTNSNGEYLFYTGTGSVTVTPVFENATYFTVTPNDFSFTFTATEETETANFCITPNGNHPDLEVTLLPIVLARPGFDAVYKIICKNKGNQIQSGAVSFAFDDTKSDFVEATPLVNAQSDGLLTWNFSNLQPAEIRIITVTLNINSPGETAPVNNGDILDFTASISSSDTDETPSDNQITLHQTVVGSFDPNDKTVTEGSQISISEAGGYLHYLVRFQNTGNYQAEKVVIRDVLSDLLDWNTLEMVTSSHSYRSTLTDENRLEVFFDGIDLPPSSLDEAGSNGYIAFKIKPVSSIAVNDVIENTAQIYFDFNFPITTNTVSTTVTQLANPAFDSASFVLYPNPTNSRLTIILPNATDFKEATIYTVLGQKVMTLTSVTTDVNALSSGTYFIAVETNNGSSTKKFIKF